LLITDFSMPGTNGVALIENLQAKKRNLPAILITGCAAQCAIRFDTASFLSFNKPVCWSELQEAITILLGSVITPPRLLSGIAR
jgi:FixJ family two-component response regulator